MRIYIAHSYGRRHNLTDKECEANVRRCIENFVRPIILKGHNPFPPLLWHYIHIGWEDSPDEATYFRLVSDWIEDCDALLVAEMPPWENSGVAREVKIAQALGKAIYWDLESIP